MYNYDSCFLFSSCCSEFVVFFKIPSHYLRNFLLLFIILFNAFLAMPTSENKTEFKKKAAFFYNQHIFFLVYVSAKYIYSKYMYSNYYGGRKVL